jgi:hypothetical protein
VIECAVQLLEVLADPLLAGDCAALGGGDDLLLGGLELVEQRPKLCGERIAVG